MPKYEWIYMGREEETEVEDVEWHAAEWVTRNHRRAEWKDTGYGHGWVIECDDLDTASSVSDHMTKNGFLGRIYSL